MQKPRLLAALSPIILPVGILLTSALPCSLPQAGLGATPPETDAIPIGQLGELSSGWQPVELTNEALRAKGVRTGDGAQWFRSMTIAPSDPDFMIWGTDVGGLFRSLDGGQNWEPANVGFHSRGTAGVAVDPHNPRRVVVIAANSVAHHANGIYLSTDQAASWSQVLSLKMSSSQDRGRQQVVFDPSSYDPETERTRIVWWSRIAQDRAGWGTPDQNPALYRSEDGGESWFEIPESSVASGARLAAHPTDGSLFAATEDNLLHSTDRGNTWRVVLPGNTTGVTISKADPDTIWASQPQAILVSRDRGQTWATSRAAAGLARPDGRFKNIAISPADPSRIVFYQKNPNYDFPRFYSHDGGSTWKRSEVKRGFSLIPSNSREGFFAFHPTDPNIILAPGGDYPALSRDGGKTYSWSANGVNNLLVGGSFHFSTIDPDVVFIGSQDYGAVLTSDGGRNWSYFGPGGKDWGGFNYGAYASIPEVLIVGEAENWGSAKRINRSFDRGKTWVIDSRSMASETYTSYGSPRNSDILFASPFRSINSGITWSQMDGASHVYTHDPISGDLIGILRSSQRSSGDTIVRSADDGATWQPLFTSRGPVIDLAYDHLNDRYWIVDNHRLRQWSEGAFLPDPALPHDQDGYPRVRSVATDPVDPSVIYAAANRDAFSTSAAAFRSLDGGQTWENLTRQQPLDGKSLDGGREAQWVRVHPRTREPWFATGCYGIWKHSAP